MASTPCAPRRRWRFTARSRPPRKPTPRTQRIRAAHTKTFPIVGVAQPTLQSATLAGGKITLLRSDKWQRLQRRRNSSPLLCDAPGNERQPSRNLRLRAARIVAGFRPGAGEPDGVLTGQDINLASLTSPLCRFRSTLTTSTARTMSCFVRRPRWRHRSERRCTTHSPALSFRSLCLRLKATCTSPGPGFRPAPIALK